MIIQKQVVKRSSAGEFSGSGKFEEREYAVRKGDRQGQNAYRGTLEYEDILDGLKHIKHYPKKLKRTMTSIWIGLVILIFHQLVVVVIQLHKELLTGQENKHDADTVVVVNQNNIGGSGNGGGQPMTVPVTTKDNSSASQIVFPCCWLASVDI